MFSVSFKETRPKLVVRQSQRKAAEKEEFLTRNALVPTTLLAFSSLPPAARSFSAVMSHSPAAEAGPSSGIKRPRLDHSFVQDPHLWMNDGNIIVTAVEETEDDKTTYAFRVHQSLLAKHSPVFQDLFTVSNTAKLKRYEDIPIVALPDPYKDVKGLLQMFYDPTYDAVSFLLPFDSDKLHVFSYIPVLKKQLVDWKHDLNIIEGPLRLAAKYELAAFHERLAAVLKAHWPSKVLDWDERWQAFRDWKTHTKQFDVTPDPPQRSRLDLCGSSGGC